MKKPEYKSAYRLDINYGSINDYVREKERCDGYNKALEESEAYYEELLSNWKENYKTYKTYELINIPAMGMWNNLKILAKELGWDKQ